MAGVTVKLFQYMNQPNITSALDARNSDGAGEVVLYERQHIGCSRVKLLQACDSSGHHESHRLWASIPQPQNLGEGIPTQLQTNSR